MTRDVSDVGAPEAWAEIWEKSVSWVPAWEEEFWLSGLVVARRICALRAPCVCLVESWWCKSSPYIEKLFNSKVIKSFVPEIRSRKCFCVSGFLCYLNVSYEHSMYISHIHVWLCNIGYYSSHRWVFTNKKKEKTLSEWHEDNMIYSMLVRGCLRLI